MNKYPCLKNILPIYSANTGLDDDVLDEMLINSHTSDALHVIKQELQDILIDENISLVEFLDMDGLEVYPAEDENDARWFIVDRIWNVLFPDEKKTLQFKGSQFKGSDPFNSSEFKV